LLFKQVFISVFFAFSILLHAGTFKVSYDPDYAPFSYSINNKAYGLFIDIWNQWAKKNKHTITFIKAKNWNDAIELAKRGEVDFFLGTTPYESWMQASFPYYRTQTALYTLKPSPKHIGKVGIIGNDYATLLKHTLPEASVISYDTYESLLKALVDHTVDAIYDDNVAITFYTIKNRYRHLIREEKTFSSISNICAISSNSKNIAIFNKGFKHLDLHTLESLETNWIHNSSLRYYNNPAFLEKTTITYVYDPDWKPFEYQDEMSKTHMGIIADVLSILSTHTGITFRPMHTESWNDSVSLVRSGKAEMFSAVPYSKERARYVNFTQHDIYNYPAVLVSSSDTPPTLDRDFHRKTIGIVKGNALGKWIKTHYPHAHFLDVKNVQEGFEAIEAKKIDFFGINGVTALYYINVLGYDNAKIYTNTDYMFRLKIAVRKDVDPKILSRIDEGLTQIPQKTLSDIYHKWTSVQVKKEINWKLLLSLVALASSIILVFILINRRLKTLVKRKTSQLSELNENLEIKVKERTEALTEINRKMQEGLTYASLIQNSILPSHTQMHTLMDDLFIIWQPKDTVGGDIYFYHQPHPDEAYLYVIDCTGHGVSGAFVTMLLKAIHEQIILQMEHTRYTPSSILQYFNTTFKQLLQQEQSKSDVGLDAAVVHIDKQHCILTYAGANIPLYYVSSDGKVIRIKADRHSLGYHKSAKDPVFKEHTIALEKDRKFYLTTDGFPDQNGGEKGFPFGRKRFMKMLSSFSHLPMEEQKKHFIDILSAYQGDEERNDDITFIGFSVVTCTRS